jgi:hypothetical protein
MDTTPPVPTPPTKRQKKTPKGFNLSGERINTLNDQLQRKIETVVVRPTNISNVNLANFWSFQFRARKNQWIRLKPDSLTVQIWGRITNPERQLAGNQKARAEYWGLCSKAGTPAMFLDPSVQATGFVKSIDVFINNVQVPTNGCMNNHLLHYTRASRIFHSKAKDFIRRHSDIQFPVTSSIMREATKAFDYRTWDNTKGVRVPIFLDGIFPFDFRNKTIESIDKDDQFETLYFPPETQFEIRVHLFKDKIESIFHAGMEDFADSYYASEPANAVPNNLMLTFQDVTLEYEATELVPLEHVNAITKFENGSIAVYPYDIPRVQYQSLPSGQSYTTNTFQIQPMARLFYLLFLPNWGTFPMDSKKKPLSGFSQFPIGSTKITLSFASDANLITDNFEEFGIRGTHHQISKKIYFDYLKERNIFTGDFEDVFPQNENDRSTLQMFVYDLQHQMSQKTELLTVSCTYGQGDSSPQDTQIMCISVHPNGKATCTYNSPSSDYIWAFSHTS